MPTPPSFILEGEIAVWTSAAASITLPGVAVQANDVLVLSGMREKDDVAMTATHDGGSGMPFTQRVDQGNGLDTTAGLGMWVARADGAKTVICTLTASGGAEYGGIVLVFRSSPGIGNVGQTTSGTGTGAPQVTITRTQTNSVVVVAYSDWTANTGARTWLTDAGTFTEQGGFSDGTRYGAYAGYHADAGATSGAVIVGISTPNTERYNIGAVEVLGVAPDPPELVTQAIFPKFLLQPALPWQENMA
jgi:hypothetical protein